MCVYVCVCVCVCVCVHTLYRLFAWRHTHHNMCSMYTTGEIVCVCVAHICMCKVFEDWSKPVVVSLGRREVVGVVGGSVGLTVTDVEVGEVVAEVGAVSFGNTICTLHRFSVQQQK